MNKKTVTFFLLVIGTCAAFANTYLKSEQPQVFASVGARFLLRLEVPVHKGERLEVAATIFRFVSESSSYLKLTTFSIGGTRVPQKVLISPDGARIIAVSYNMAREEREDVVQVFDGRGGLLKTFALADIYLKEDIESYWKHDERDVGAWLEEAYLTDKNSVYFKCRDVVGDFRLHDYLLDLATLKVVVFER